MENHPASPSSSLPPPADPVAPTPAPPSPPEAPSSAPTTPPAAASSPVSAESAAATGAETEAAASPARQVAHQAAQQAQAALKEAGAELGNEKNLAMFCHLSALVGPLLMFWVMLPIGNLIGPLLIWLWKKDTMPMVNEHGREALNFQITVSLAMLPFLLISLIPLIGLLAIPFLFLIGAAALVLTIIGTIKASNGVLYRYPFTLRLVK